MRAVRSLPAVTLALAIALGCSREGAIPADSAPTPRTTRSEARKTPPAESLDEWKRPAEIQENISVERCYAGGNSKQQYFLMRHQKPAKPVDEHGLVVILPGGPGTAEFLPFCANVLTGFAIPDDFLVAQLVAPIWRQSDDRIVWPSHVFPDKEAEFTSEAFLAAIIDEVSKKESIDERFVFTLGWSSSGHVQYSASTRVPEVRGSVIAMSRFLPGCYVETDRLKGKAYYLYHSPEDRICPFAEAELAAKTLKEHGVEVKLISYKGGHGWQPYTFYGDRIKEGILWLKDLNAIEPRGHPRE
ncbi:MAG: alpha/beta hydrolase [Planctomycetota bacterium]|jgi:predicted esterase